VKQKISGPVALAIIAVVAVALVGFLYTQYVQERKVSPEETRKMMMKHNGH
jgi:cell division protein FtsN